MAIEFDLAEIPETERESYKEMTLELLGGIGKLADADQREWKNLTEEEIYKIKTGICCKCKYLSGDGHNCGNGNKTCEYIDMENRIRGAFPGIGCLKKGKFKLGISKYRARALRVKHG